MSIGCIQLMMLNRILYISFNYMDIQGTVVCLENLTLKSNKNHLCAIYLTRGPQTE